MGQNRFAGHKAFSFVPRRLLSLLLFSLAALLVLRGISSVAETAQEERLQTTQNAVVRAAVQCYALEGAYPPDLAYLRQHYGLRVDEAQYIIHYERFASNLMPQIFVLSKNQDGGGDLLGSE